MVVSPFGGGGNGSLGVYATAAPPPSGYPYAVQRFDDITPSPGTGERHLAAGQTFDGYNSDPPTSGVHGPAVDWAVHDNAVPKESAVHNMEHGGVVIWYNCNGGPAPLGGAECTQLRRDLTAEATAALQQSKRVLMTPYPAMEHRIALTSWQILDAFDEFDAQRVQAFIDTFICYTKIEGC